MMKNPLLVVLVMLAVFGLILLAGCTLLLLPWLRAFMHGTPVSVFDIIGMRLRGHPPRLLIDAYIALKQADVSVRLRDVEHVYINNRNRIAISDDLVELVKKASTPSEC